MTLIEAAGYLHLLASLTLFGTALFPIYAGADASPSARTVQRIAAVCALLCATALLALQIQRLGATPAAMLGTGIGRVWFTQIVLTLALTALTWRGAREIWIAAFAALDLCGFALIGHANAIAGLSGAIVQALHLLAGGAWFGGIVALALALRAQPSSEIVKRFSGIGLASVVVLALSGFRLHAVNTGALLPISGVAYGQLADLKIMLLFGALALAGFHRFVATPRGAWTLMGRTLVLELAILAFAVAVAVRLAGTEPYG